jgi:cation/acetate symporter
MTGETSVQAVAVFLVVVAAVLGLSFYFARKTKSASSYYAAGGQIPWAVNGIAFAGDYLSAASFLGICGMIATVGYDGFLYSIGYLAGWVVALFVVAEPMKRLGKYTFTDALDSKFDSRGIKLAAAVSTLLVSICYLIPQMVGAGVLVQPLLGFPHAVGVIMVGAIVIIIVATAGMTSTTYVQFIKGAMLIVFSTVLVVAVCVRGLSTTPEDSAGEPAYQYQTMRLADAPPGAVQKVKVGDVDFVKLTRDNATTWWKQDGEQLREIQWETVRADGSKWINGAAASAENTLRPVGSLASIAGKSGDEADTGSVSPVTFLSLLGDKQTEIVRWKMAKYADGGDQVTLHYPVNTPGQKVLRPGLKYKVEGTLIERLDFVSLMLALFFGTAALPHILIRYYTVPSPSAARKSTIVAIAAIGFFYVLTLFMGLGAMVNQVVNPLDNNMSAPLLARSFGTFLFAIISAIAFATVLGTVSGLIVASSGAVAHDLMDRFLKLGLSDKSKVLAGKIAAIVVGVVAIVLGILFQGVNVSFLVGWAFAVAASANLPAILMLLFWKRTTAKGIVASIVVGIVSSIGLFLLSPGMYPLYGLKAADAPFPLENPGIVSVPLSFITIVVVSLMTTRRESATQDAAA